MCTRRFTVELAWHLASVEPSVLGNGHAIAGDMRHDARRGSWGGQKSNSSGLPMGLHIAIPCCGRRNCCGNTDASSILAEGPETTDTRLISPLHLPFQISLLLPAPPVSR